MEQRFQPLGVRIHTVCLHQQAHPKALGNGAQQLEGLRHEPVVHLSFWLGIAVSQNADIRGTQFFRQNDILHDFRDILVKVLFIL